MGDSVFDLFGNPIRDGHGKRGRPPFEWTVEKSNKVKLALARGWSNERIANALAVSLATLKRYFRAELKERDMARDQLDLDRFALAWEAAKGGNVGAMRQVDRLMDADARLHADAKFRGGGRDDDSPAKDKPLGKKAQAIVDAEAAGGEGTLWGEDLSPGRYN